MKIGLSAAALVLALAALPAGAETPAAQTVGDPLTRLILSRQLTQADGGITGAVRIGSGQTIELKAVTEKEALSGLAPVEGLKPAKSAAKAKARRSRRAVEQLKAASESKLPLPAL